MQQPFNIDSLGKYMLTEKRMKEIAEMPDMQMQIVEKKNKSHKSDSPLAEGPFFPREKDSLFWCFYIMKNGQEAYKDLGQINIVIEKKIKIEYIEFLREKKLVLKTHKMAPLAHVENCLLNEFKIDIKTFLALCVSEGISIMYIHKNTYYELNVDADENNIKTLVRTDQPLRYGYEMNNNVQQIRETRFKVDNLAKPLKAMSSYKLEELQTFCTKLAIPLCDQKIKKKDLYEKIVQYLS